MTIFSQSDSFFDEANRPWESLLLLQVDPSSPSVSGLTQASGMILPDTSVRSRLAHFPEDLYDLRESSHLVRFLKAMLGDAGVGQLRMRYSVVQFQSTMTGSHFFDLDRFYGAIFGVQRIAAELLPINPHSDVATSEEWDEIRNRDASYRDRVRRLSSAIGLGATLPGLKAAAEAIVNAECDVYESWAWDDAGESPSIGRTGTSSRMEIVVVPKKDYAAIEIEHDEETRLLAQYQDEANLVRVLSILKPAACLLTVDIGGLTTHEEVPIAQMVSDSNYWEVLTRVTPRQDLVGQYESVYPRSNKQVEDGLLASDARVLPQPPFSYNGPGNWTYAAEISNVYSYALTEDDQPDVTHGVNYDEQIVFLDGTTETFEANRSVMDSRTALMATYSADGVLVAHPYSGPREVAFTNG